jgi:sporulation protein YlmC with PRC-barrel domain
LAEILPNKEIIMDIPINASVFCTEGMCGKSTVVIINPKTKQISHVVVKDNRFPHEERLVPIDLVKETTSNSIQLNISQEELMKMDNFVEYEFIQTEEPYHQYSAPRYLVWPYVYPLDEHLMDIQYEQVPPGEMAIHRGAQVNASDGRVGTVDEFLMDPTNDHITHFILREGHLWGKKDVTIPINQVDRISENTVYLKSDKSEIEKLPAISVQRWWN